MNVTTALQRLLLLAGLLACCKGRTLDRLYHDLLRGYNPLVIPTGDTGDESPVVVKLGMTLLMAKVLSEDVVEVDGWMETEWVDPRLMWNPSEYDSIAMIHLPQKLIWIPDITMYNNVNVRQQSEEKFLAMVSNTGTIFVVNKFTHHVPCIDQLGTRKCRMKFGSWTYHGFSLDLKNRSESVDLSNLQIMTKYTIVDVAVTPSTVYYACCPEPFPDVTFNFTLQRRKDQTWWWT